MGFESISDFIKTLLLISGDVIFLSIFIGDGFGGKNDLFKLCFGGNFFTEFKSMDYFYFFSVLDGIVIFFLDLVVNKFIKSELSFECF